MKSPYLGAVCVAVFAGSLFSQAPVKAVTGPVATDLFDIGGKHVRLPAPDNFTDTMILYPWIAGRLLAVESPLNEVLAVHVIDEIVPLLKAGEEPDLPFYTKVSVSKHLKSVEFESVDFRALVTEFEKQSPGTLQSIVKTAEKGTAERLSNFWGDDPNLSIGETRILGHFDKQPQSISSMFVMNAEMFKRKLLFLGSMSMVHVNKRLIFLYVFCIPTNACDRETVASLTNSWTAKTISANK